MTPAAKGAPVGAPVGVPAVRIAKDGRTALPPLRLNEIGRGRSDCLLCHRLCKTSLTRDLLNQHIQAKILRIAYLLSW